LDDDAVLNDDRHGTESEVAEGALNVTKRSILLRRFGCVGRWIAAGICGIVFGCHVFLLSSIGPSSVLKMGDGHLAISDFPVPLMALLGASPLFSTAL
jgi:hypothetical protein